jgi:hypothetical protein
MATGNDGAGSGDGTLNRYAWPSWVIAVGGGDKLGALAAYSSRGDGVHNPTLIAPASYIASARAITGVVTDTNSTPFDLTDPMNPRAVPAQWDAHYTVALGTSMAAPHVSGVVALMLQAAPALVPDQVKEILAQTVTPMPGCPAADCGAGYVNAMAAVQRARVVADRPPLAALTATPSSGGSPLSVTLDASGSRDPDGTVVQYRWDVDGNGVVDLTTATPVLTHTYTTGRWSPSVTSVDNLGVPSAPATAGVLVDNPPTARATVPRRAGFGQPVRFDGSASSDPDGSIASWVWSFGDGTSGTGAVATHTFAAPPRDRQAQMVTWRLTVTDNLGRSSSLAGTIKLTD